MRLHDYDWHVIGTVDRYCTPVEAVAGRGCRVGKAGENHAGNNQRRAHPERSSRYLGACRSVLSAHHLQKILLRRAGLGAAGRHPRGWRRIQARRLTCLSTASCAAPTGRVPGLRGAFIIASTHRALVLVLGTNIAVLLGCSKSSRQCDVYYLRYLLTSREGLGRVTFPGGLGRPRAPAPESLGSAAHQRTESTSLRCVKTFCTQCKPRGDLCANWCARNS